jgi:hypothetical protein
VQEPHLTVHLCWAASSTRASYTLTMCCRAVTSRHTTAMSFQTIMFLNDSAIHSSCRSVLCVLCSFLRWLLFARTPLHVQVSVSTRWSSCIHSLPNRSHVTYTTAHCRSYKKLYSDIDISVYATTLTAVLAKACDVAHCQTQR